MRRLSRMTSLIGLVLPLVFGQDDIGFSHGVIDLSTSNFEIKLIKDSGTLASLRPTGSDFDFLPYDYLLLGRRVQNGSYQWGDINIRYRDHCAKNWTDGNSAAQRTPVLSVDTGALAASNLSPTMTTGPLNITREWIDVSGDLGLQFTIENTGKRPIELGSIGFPAALNNIFTSRNASDMYNKCSFMDPYIGLDAGHLRVTPISGVGPALVVTPLHSTPLEAYRYLDEESRGGTRIGSNGWEGYFEWQTHTKAWASNEWKGVEPWNPPTAVVLKPGGSTKYGFRFSVVEDGIRGIDASIRKTGTPTAMSVPGYILPRDVPGQLFLQSTAEVASVSVSPEGALHLMDQGNNTYTVQPSSASWGRVRLTIKYEDDKTQTIHYYITKPATDAVSDLGRFLTTEQWFDAESDPFGRSPSIMGYDNEVDAIIEQEQRPWIAGLSDEGGAGPYVSAAIKQVFHPNAKEIAKLETFIDKVLFKTIQDSNYGVKRSVFFYEPEVMPDYNYSTSIKWNTAYDRDYEYEITRAYNYVWPAATYWALYRVARSYPSLVKNHDWEWYLDQAYQTVMRGMSPDIGYNTEGLMGETVFGEILSDLIREEWSAQADDLTAAMRARVDNWLTKEYPFGSEQTWDSTGQEGVYYWTRYFGETEMSDKTRNSVLGYVPTLPHWGYNGNARRYWDFVVTGKLQVIERQIHHYGSGLNALTLLSAYRDDPSDSYLLRVGYGGTSGPLSNIHQNGFASCAMHAWPEHLSWDGYSGDYGPNFVGLALGSGTYLAEDSELGLVVYGGLLEMKGKVATVKVRDAVRQKVFIGPLGVEIKVDAGIIESFTYNLGTKGISFTLGQLEGAPRAAAVVVWVSTSGSASAKARPYKVVADHLRVKEERQGWRVPLGSDTAEVRIELE